MSGNDMSEDELAVVRDPEVNAAVEAASNSPIPRNEWPTKESK